MRKANSLFIFFIGVLGVVGLILFINLAKSDLAEVEPAPAVVGVEETVYESEEVVEINTLEEFLANEPVDVVVETKGVATEVSVLGEFETSVPDPNLVPPSERQYQRLMTASEVKASPTCQCLKDLDPVVYFDICLGN